MTEKKLTPKQERFVSEYLKTGSATEAAKRAGYSEKYAGQNADKLLKNTNVAKAIKAKNDKRNERFELEEDYELKMARKILDKAMEMGDLQSANGAVKIMAQIRGKFIKKIQVGFADNLAEELGLLDDDQQ